MKPWQSACRHPLPDEPASMPQRRSGLFLSSSVQLWNPSSRNPPPSAARPSERGRGYEASDSVHLVDLQLHRRLPSPQVRGIPPCRRNEFRGDWVGKYNHSVGILARVYRRNCGQHTRQAKSIPDHPPWRLTDENRNRKEHSVSIQKQVSLSRYGSWGFVFCRGRAEKYTGGGRLLSQTKRQFHGI